LELLLQVLQLYFEILLLSIVSGMPLFFCFGEIGSENSRLKMEERTSLQVQKEKLKVSLWNGLGIRKCPRLAMNWIRRNIFQLSWRRHDSSKRLKE
jgi:hypothetical protein